jgi:hypothetical protein
MWNQQWDHLDPQDQVTANQEKFFVYGAQGRNRTTDTAIFSRMLYQLSYLGAPVAGGPRRTTGLIEAPTGRVQPLAALPFCRRPG